MLFNFFSKLKWIAIMALLLTIGLFSSSATPLFAHDGDNPSPDGLTPPPPPDLPPPSEQQILYRIDPLQSQAQYSVQEVYVGGIDGKLVVGQTSGIAGDFDLVCYWSQIARQEHFQLAGRLWAFEPREHWPTDAESQLEITKAWAEPRQSQTDRADQCLLVR